MLYPTLRWTAATALQWLYRDVRVEGRERVPAHGPLLVAFNHPNQLIDVLLVATALDRRVLFTGKAVLLDNPLVAALFRAVGFVPLRRASDERARREAEAAPLGGPGAGPAAPTTGPAGSAPPDPARNADAFRAIVDALADGRAVLVFPEGISHNAPELAPLKTGVARAALQAAADPRVRGLRVLPVGLTFERKWEPRTRALVQFGDPLDVAAWLAEHGGEAAADGAPRNLAESLTRAVDRRLRDVTLNFESAEAARQVMAVSELVSEVLADGVRPLAEPGAPLGAVAGVARRAGLVRQRLASLGPDDRRRVEGFLERLDAFRGALAAAGVPPSEIGLDTGVAPGARFVVREAAVVLGLGPVAWWGRLNHWLPLRLARAIARRTSRTPEDPAMHTLVVGLGLVLAFYVLQTALVCWWAGPGWGALYLLSLPAAARWDFRFRERMRRAAGRVRSYLRFRRDPALQARLLAEARWLREEAAAIDERAATAGDGGSTWSGGEGGSGL